MGRRTPRAQKVASRFGPLAGPLLLLQGIFSKRSSPSIIYDHLHSSIKTCVSQSELTFQGYTTGSLKVY